MGADRLRFDPFPRGRILLRLGFLLIWSGCLAVSAAASPKGQPSRDPSFREFVASLWPPAAERGVSRQTFDRAFQGISFDRKSSPRPPARPSSSAHLGLYRRRRFALAHRARPRQGREGERLAREGEETSASIRRPHGHLGSGDRLWRLRRVDSVIRPSPASPTPAVAATTSAMNCCSRSSFSRRGKSSRGQCAAPGRERWG